MKGAKAWLAGALVAAALSVAGRAGAEAEPAGGADARPRPSDVPAASDDRTPEVSTEYFVETHDGFTVAYHPAARERVREVVPKLSPIRDELSRLLGVAVLEEVELRVAAVPVELDRLSPPTFDAVASHGGFSFPERRLVVVSLEGADSAGEDLELALRHQLAHLAIVEATRGASMPAWFDEGLASHFAGAHTVSRWTELELATLSGDPPSLAELGRGEGPRARAIAADFSRFAESEGAIPPLLDGVRRGLPFERALESAFGADASHIDRAWRRDGTVRYGVIPLSILLVSCFVLALLVRRHRRRAKERSASASRHIHHRRARHYARRRETKIRVPVHVADRDVPTVEHDGRYHTLH